MITRYLLFGLLLCVTPLPAQASPQERADAPSPIRLDDAACRSFDTAFHTISEKGHVFIVSEGTPLSTTLTDEQLGKLRHDLPVDSTASPSDAITKLALAYDYDTEQTGPQTFLLRKRYSDPKDLPCVTYDEIVYSLRNILRAIDSNGSISSGEGNAQPCQQLFTSLTPEQQGKAQKGLMLSDLTPEQQQIARSAIEDVILEPRIRDISAFLQFLPALKQESTTLGWNNVLQVDRSYKKSFGFSRRYGLSGVVRVFPISYPYRLKGIGGYEFPPATGVPTTDLTIPDAQEQALASGMLANALPTTLTLRQATAKASHASVEDPIADKPINLFGASYAPNSQHLLQAIADVYGLRLVVDDKHQYAITLPRPRPIETPADLSKEIQRLTPLSLERALDGQARVIIEKNKKADRGNNDSKTDDPVIQDRRQRQEEFLNNELRNTALMQATRAYYYPSVRRLIALAKASVPTPTSPAVPVSALAPESDRLIALILMSDTCLESLLKLQSFVPPDSFVHMDRAILQISQNKIGEMEFLTVNVQHQEPSGQIHFDSGSSFAAIPVKKTLVSP